MDKSKGYSPKFEKGCIITHSGLVPTLPPVGPILSARLKKREKGVDPRDLYIEKLTIDSIWEGMKERATRIPIDYLILKPRKQKHQTIMNELQKLEDKAHSNLGMIKQKTIDLIQNAELFFGDGVEDSEQLGAYLYEIGICLEIYDISMKIDIGLIKELEDILESMQAPETVI